MSSFEEVCVDYSFLILVVKTLEFEYITNIIIDWTLFKKTSKIINLGKNGKKLKKKSKNIWIQKFTANKYNWDYICFQIKSFLKKVGSKSKA